MDSFISFLQTLRKVPFLLQRFPFYVWSCRLRWKEILTASESPRPEEIRGGEEGEIIEEREKDCKYSRAENG